MGVVGGLALAGAMTGGIGLLASGAFRKGRSGSGTPAIGASNTVKQEELSNSEQLTSQFQQQNANNQAKALQYNNSEPREYNDNPTAKIKNLLNKLNGI